MAAIDFPSNPTLGQIFTASDKEWQWDGTAWQLVSSDTNVISTTLIDAKGDLIVGASADAVARLGVGTDGQVLTASSDATEGLLWTTIQGSLYQSASPSSPSTGQLWVDSDDNLIYVYTGSTWIAAGAAGATGGGSNKVFYENDQTITTNYTITSSKNAMSAGPITINDGVTVTIPSGSVWTVV